MKIDLLENGMDSLGMGFASFLEFEKNTVEKSPQKADYLDLKHAILFTHHGVEILLKFILRQVNELFIISKIDNAYLEAYQKQKKDPSCNIFDFCELSPIHTITYEEALNRVEKICDLQMQKPLIDKLKKLNQVRNALTHAELNIDDAVLTDIFQSLLNDLDILFYKAIGARYKTLTGYSELVRNYDAYMAFLTAHGMELKKKTTQVFKQAIEEIGLSLGQNEIARITDLALAKKFVRILNCSGLQFGMDMFDGCCSGNTEIKILDETHFSLWTKDNKSDFRFKFKSLILYIPEVTKNASPILMFESDDDTVEEDYKNYLHVDEFSGRHLEGLCFTGEPQKRETFNYEEICEFYSRRDYDEYFVIPPYYSIRRYFDRKIFACLNVQGLAYWNFRQLLLDMKEKSGHEVEVYFKNL